MGRPPYPQKPAKYPLERTILCSTVKHNPRSCCLANNANEVSVAYTHPQHNGGESIKLLRQEAGKWLKKLREEQGLSQSQLAAKIGVDYYGFVSQIEAGRARVPPDRYEVWAEAMEMDAGEFVRKLLRYYDPITYELAFARANPAQAEGV